MLSDTEIQRYMMLEHQLSPTAQTYITQVRSTDPSRMVGVHAKRNVSSWVPSKKMGGITISTESRSAERCFSLLCEYDERILEFWDQPDLVKVERTDRNGRENKGSYTPDFLVLSIDGPCVVEVKPEDKIKKLMAIYPNDWEEVNGEYLYRPAVNAFEKIGLQHRVFAYKNSMRCKAINLDMLIRSRLIKSEEKEFNAALVNAFNESFFWNLFELRDRLDLRNFAPLLKLIDNGDLFFDLDNDLLSEPKGVIVVRKLSLLVEAKKFNEIKKLTLESSFDPVSIFELPSEKYAEEVVERLTRIESGESSRSVRRWNEKIRRGLAQGLTKFQSLVSKKYLSGRKGTQLNKSVYEYLHLYLVTVHAKKKGISKYRSYVNYKVLVEDMHSFDPVCWRTFYRHLEKIPADVIAFGRGGKRAANAVAEPSDPENRLLKSDVPWKLAAIDHYLADIYLIFFSDDGVVHVMRPWVTAMVDTCTSTILAFSVGFSNPSRKSVAKVLRACVRDHGMLPAEIIVDRGSEFRSVYFASLLAHYGVIYSLRPAAHSRYGSEVEGFFGDFKRMWLSQREGNLADYKEARAVDGKLAPKKFAVLKPYDFYRELKTFCSWRDHKPRGIYSESPYDRQHRGQIDFPIFGVHIQYDENFLIATAVETETYKIDFSRGIHINDQYYWSPFLGDLRGKKSNTEVRPDPENPHLVYARVDNTWVSCTTSHATRFTKLDPVSQFCEGLTVSEAKTARKNVAEQADMALVRKIREMDKIAAYEDGATPVINIDVDVGEDAVEVSIFEKIKNSSVRKLTSGVW